MGHALLREARSEIQFCRSYVLNAFHCLKDGLQPYPERGQKAGNTMEVIRAREDDPVPGGVECEDGIGDEEAVRKGLGGRVSHLVVSPEFAPKEGRGQVLLAVVVHESLAGEVIETGQELTSEDFRKLDVRIEESRTRSGRSVESEE
jgi:hypothetical protein